MSQMKGQDKTTGKQQNEVEMLYRVAKTRPGAHCGSEHELLIAKFRIKLKKVGKTTGPFWCNLNQILYD